MQEDLSDLDQVEGSMVKTEGEGAVMKVGREERAARGSDA